MILTLLKRFKYTLYFLMELIIFYMYLTIYIFRIIETKSSYLIEMPCRHFKAEDNFNVKKKIIAVLKAFKSKIF